MSEMESRRAPGFSPDALRLLVDYIGRNDDSFMRAAPMQIAEVIETGQGQAVRLPDEFRFDTAQVFIHREGDVIVLQPIRKNEWPPNFFEQIRINDPAFVQR